MWIDQSTRTMPYGISATQKLHFLTTSSFFVESEEVEKKGNRKFIPAYGIKSVLQQMKAERDM